MEPVSNVSRFTRLMLIIIGIALIVIGTALSALQITSVGEPQTTATITSFKDDSGSETFSPENTVTIVSYEIDGKLYKNVELGQYEEKWNVGDTLKICYSPDDPESIRTKTMTYIGFIIILASLPFIIIGIYTLTNLNRRAAMTPEEIAEDEERTTAGKLKYKVSSIVISLGAGIPVTLIGFAFMYLEHNSALGWLCIFLGLVTTMVGVRSIVLFAIIKYRHKKEFAKMIKNSPKLPPPANNS